MNVIGDESGGRRHEATTAGVQGQIVLEMLDAWRHLDLDDAMSRVADDIVFAPDLKSKPVRGRDALRSLWGRYMGLFASYDVEVQTMVTSDRLVCMERIERITRIDGQTMLLPVATVFELNTAGKITAWRDYWDTTMAEGVGGG